LIWDSKRHTLSLPLAFQKKVRDSITRFIRCKFITRRQLEKIVGLINFACVASPLGRIYLKRVNRYLRALARRRLRDIPVLLSQEFRAKLLFWLKLQVLKSHVPWRTPPPSVELLTDASNKGWGFHTSDRQQGKGQWKSPINSFHINVKEFVAVWIPLQNCHWRKGMSIKLHLDNTSVVNCLNRGDSKSWTLTAVHIKRELNVLHRLPFQESSNASRMDAGRQLLSVPEVNASRRTKAEVVARTSLPSHNLQLLHRIDVGGRDYWGFGMHGGTTPERSG